MNRAAIALALALVAPFTWAATTKPVGVTTTYTNAAGRTTTAEVLLRSETTAGAVATRRAVGTSVSTLGNMAKTAISRRNAVGVAITAAVVGVGWYIDEATNQVMTPNRQPINPSNKAGLLDCVDVPNNSYVSNSQGTWAVVSYTYAATLKAPWTFRNNCTIYPSVGGYFPKLMLFPAASGIPDTSQPKVVPWGDVISSPTVPTSGLPQSSVSDGTWAQDWPELQGAVSTVNNSITNFYEGDKTNYDSDIVNNTRPADETQMPSLAPWQPAIQPLTDLGGDIPKTTAPISNMPTLPSVAGSGICRGFDVNIPPILVGTLDRHCYYIDNFIRPFLMWFFYMLTAGYLYGTWKREVFKGIS